MGTGMGMALAGGGGEMRGCEQGNAHGSHTYTAQCLAKDSNPQSLGTARSPKPTATLFPT